MLRLTRIAKLVPLLASAKGNQNTSGAGAGAGAGAGGVWFAAKYLIPKVGYRNESVLWQLKWPQHMIDELIMSENPNASIYNSDLELAGGLLHLNAIVSALTHKKGNC